jgi:hypothetical protein
MGNRLSELGFEILDDKDKNSLKRPKTILIEKVQTGEIEEHVNLGEKIEKIKEWLT